MLLKNLDRSRMLNKITILQRVGIPAVADRFMDRSRTTAIRGISSVRGIKLNLRLLRRRSGQTPTFAIIPSTAAAGDIQADDTKDSGLFGDPPLKPSTKPSSGRDKTTTKQPNPPLNRTYSSVLRRPRNFSPVKVSKAEFGGEGRFLFSEVGENRQGLLPKETWYLLRNKRRQPPSES